jgi:hypothetical protein
LSAFFNYRAIAKAAIFLCTACASFIIHAASPDFAATPKSIEANDRAEIAFWYAGASDLDLVGEWLQLLLRMLSRSAAGIVCEGWKLRGSRDPDRGEV